MNKKSAFLISASALAFTALAGKRASPSPDHLRTAAWYGSLHKAPFTPPGPVFGGVWAVLYPLLGWAGYRLLSAPPSKQRSTAIAAWVANVGAIALHPYLLFKRHSLGPSTTLLTAEVGAAMGLVASGSRVDPLIGYSQVPLMLWAAFADILNEELWRRN